MANLENIKQSLSRVLWAFGDDSVDLLRELHERAGMRTTGSTLEAFGNEQKEDGSLLTQEIFGADHVGALEYGRKPSGDGDGSLKEIIYRWAEQKGLFAQFEKQYEKDGLAYIITRKIHNEGTLLFRTGKTFSGVSEVVSSAFTEARLKQLNERLGEAFMTEFSSEVLKSFKNN
jgi:hypothetical protein